MKYTVFLCVLLGSLQMINAENDEVIQSERYKKCITPKLDGYLDDYKKVHNCPKGKPFGTELKISFENDDDHFSYIVKICRKKHKRLVNKIFKCALRRATKQCKNVGLPKCVRDESLLYGRWQIVNDCLVRVLRKCSNGKVSTH